MGNIRYEGALQNALANQYVDFEGLERALLITKFDQTKLYASAESLKVSNNNYQYPTEKLMTKLEESVTAGIVSELQMRGILNGGDIREFITPVERAGEIMLAITIPESKFDASLAAINDLRSKVEAGWLIA